MSTQIQWLAPAPLWSPLTSGADKTAFRAPSLLRFASDTFMTDLQTLLSQTPAGLANYVAQPETWRSPNVGLPTTTSSSSLGSAATLKLFQPVHARFYLVAASLVCRLPGLPDHTIKVNQGEKITFVLRRVQSQTAAGGAPASGQSYTEYAWIPGATPPGWTPVSGSSVAPGEDKLPLFPTTFGSNGTQRRMLAGVIPTGRKQTYVGGVTLAQNATTGQSAPPTPPDPRAIDFQRLVLDPWADLVGWSANLSDVTPDQGSSASSDVIAAAQGSALILVDFGSFLAANLPLVWTAVQNASGSSLTGAQLALYNAMSATMGDALDSQRYTLAQAIALASSFDSAFESEVLPLPGAPAQPLPSGYPGPLLTDLSDPQLANLIGRAPDQDPLSQRQILTLVQAALNEVGPAPSSAIPAPTINPQNPQGDDWYIVRCVYDRPQCAVLSLPAVPIMSPPSEFFQLASYFDPDAPARRIQVALPVDTTAAALRKYDKGVAFMISDQLNRQMQRATGLKNLMAGEVGSPGGFSLGMVCSFSIPIITICAMIVLFIFVILLNIVFFWLPFLKICFPLPSFSAKGGD
jgi:hypothetical protein